MTAARVATVLRVLGVLGLVVGAATARVVFAGETEIAASTAALEAGDAREATVRARRAAGWYAPGAPHVRVAYERLSALATAAEAIGDRDTALFAWNAVRSAATETRWLTTPHAEDLAKADLAIARLSAAAPRPPGTRAEPAAVIERAALAALGKDTSPRAPWTVLLVLSFAAWAVGAFTAARRAVSATGHIAWPAARAGGAIFAIGVVGWIVALLRA